MKAAINLILIFFCIQLSAQVFERYKSLGDTILPSKALGYPRQISVTVPMEFQQDLPGEFPLILVFDQQNTRSYTHILRTIDYLTANEQMPSAVVIGVRSEVETRYGETQFSISDKQVFGEKNEQFILDELIPLAKSRYKAAAFIMLIGHSRYGFFTTALLTRNPQKFNAVIALSPFFRQNNINLIDSVLKVNNLQLPIQNHFYRFAIGNDYPEEYHSFQNVVKPATQKSGNALNISGNLYPEADHNAVPGIAIGPLLYEIFEPWSAAQREFMVHKGSLATAADSLINKIRRNYSFDLKPALGILNGKGWEAYNNKHYTDAIQSWQMLMQYYPNLSEGWLYIADAQKRSGKSYAENIQRFYSEIKSSAFYSQEEKKELIEEAEAWEKEL